PGTGLGLSISLGIVREHEGRIWAENATQGGARFVIELPVVAPRPTGEFPSTPASHLVADRLHVLVVDDEASVRVALQRYLASRGHEVETTASGREALARMREDAFDAVIIDMRMPDASGEQLFGALLVHAHKAVFALRNLPGHGQALLRAQDLDRHRFALLVRSEDPHRVRRVRGLPPADGRDHVAALQGEGRVRRRLDDEDAVL